MTTEQKDNLYKFLWDEAMLYDTDDMELLCKWIDENISNEKDDIIRELRIQNDNLLTSLESLKNYDKNATLRQAVETIKHWHNMGAFLAGKSQSVIDDIWDLYYRNSPEMKSIREALKGE